MNFRGVPYRGKKNRSRIICAGCLNGKHVKCDLTSCSCMCNRAFLQQALNFAQPTSPTVSA